MKKKTHEEARVDVPLLHALAEHVKDANQRVIVFENQHLDVRSSV